jgi:hypothetical protein
MYSFRDLWRPLRCSDNCHDRVLYSVRYARVMWVQRCLEPSHACYCWYIGSSDPQQPGGRSSTMHELRSPVAIIPDDTALKMMPGVQTRNMFLRSLRRTQIGDVTYSKQSQGRPFCSDGIYDHYRRSSQICHESFLLRLAIHGPKALLESRHGETVTCALVFLVFRFTP